MALFWITFFEVVVALILTIITLIPYCQDWQKRKLWDKWKHTSFYAVIALFVASAAFVIVRNITTNAAEKKSQLRAETDSITMVGIQDSLNALLNSLVESGHKIEGGKIIEPAPVMIVGDESQAIQASAPVYGDIKIETTTYIGGDRILNEEGIDKLFHEISRMKFDSVILARASEVSNPLGNQIHAELTKRGYRIAKNMAQFYLPVDLYKLDLSNQKSALYIIVGK